MTAPRKTGKTGSRNPANKPTSVTQWKKSTQAPPVLLPSGNYMRLRKVGLKLFVKAGMLPNSLMALAQKSIDEGQGKHEGPTQEEMDALLQDPTKIADIANFMERVTIFSAQEPEVMPVPEDGVERNPETLYIDEIDFDDQMFIFQVVTGGTTDIETFRKQHGAVVASLRGREDVELPTE